MLYCPQVEILFIHLTLDTSACNFEREHYASPKERGSVKRELQCKIVMLEI